VFITLEGPEGSGKTSQVPLLADFLRQQGRDCITTREPGGTAIGDQIRSVLTMQPRTEILLFLAARAQLVEQVIRPALAEGKTVLCDRYGDSTLAYQGYGHNLDLDQLRQMLRFATGGLKPDLTLLLDIDVESGLRRKLYSGGEWNRLDAYAVAFHQRVRQGYHALAQSEPQRWVVIDASQPPEMVQLALRQAVTGRLK
jgi:dTMP kinase